MKSDPELDALIDEIVFSIFEHVFHELQKDPSVDTRVIDEPEPRIRNKKLIAGREEKLREYLSEEIDTLRKLGPELRGTMALASRRYTVAMLPLAAEQ